MLTNVAAKKDGVVQWSTDRNQTHTTLQARS